MKLRKIISMFLCFAILISFAPTVMAVDGPTVTVGSVAEAKAGETFTIPVSISNNTGFTNYDFHVDYDSSVMTLKTVLKSGTLAANMNQFDGMAATGNIAAAGVSDEYAEEHGTTAIAEDGVLFKLKFEVNKGATSGNYAVSIAVKADGAFRNDKQDVVATFVPGTITVKADTSDRTVQFMNGDSLVKSETVANGGKLTEIPAAPVAVDGQSFLGWYAVDGTNYVLSNADATITGTEASTGTVITADTTYHAIWASNVMIAAGYAAANGKTTIGVVAAISGLQNFVNSYTGGTVKLLKNVDLAKGYVMIQSGTTVTLDLNGKTLSANGVCDKTTNWEVRSPIVNNGNLALISSTALTDKGVVQLNETAGVAIEGNYGALTNHGTVRMENVKIVSTSTFIIDEWDSFYPACAYYGDATATITTIQNCELHANRNAALYQSNGKMEKLSDSVFESSAKSAAVFLEGMGDQHYGTIENCTITMQCDDPESSAAALEVYCSTLESVTGCTITGPDGILLHDFGSGDNISPEIRTLNSTVVGTNGYAIRTTPDLSDYGDLYKDRKAVINFTGGKYKGAKGVEELVGSATITYPAGQKLIAGEDGWYTLQNAYTVKFMNGDTVLQEGDCLANSNVKYTGTEPTKPAEGGKEYVFTGWNTASDGTGTKYSSDASIPVTGDLTLYAQFRVATAYTWVLKPDKTDYNAGETVTVTVSAYGATESQISSFGFNTDFDTDQLKVQSVAAAFTGGLVESKGGKLGYVISGKAPITISGDKNSPTKLATITFKVNDGKNGTANIKLNDFEMAMPGTDKGETVSVDPITVNLHDIQITLNAGNSTINGATTYYAKFNEEGLYTDAGRQTKASAPTVAAATGYRLADESKGEKLWQSGETGYTTEELFGSLKFTESKAFTVNTVKQWTVTFAPGEHGTFADGTKTTLTLDEGTKLSTITMPTVQPSAGYVLDTWTKDSAMDTLTGDVTYTATYKAGTYTISFPTIEKVTFTPGDGIMNGKVTYGTNAKFTMTVADGLKVKKVSYKIGETTTELKENEGTYTIPGTALTGNVTIVVESVATYTVQFKAGENGAVAKTMTVDAGYALKDSDIPTPTPNAGYRFVEWRLGDTAATPVGTEVNENLVFTAIFDDASYTISADGMGGVPATATHGKDFKFTPTVNGKIVTDITVKNGDTVVSATKNADGSYTIAGNDITGNLTITATTVDGTWEFISQDEYAALPADKQIAKLNTAKLADATYQLGSEKMFWSKTYEAYVAIVPAGETAGTLTAKLTTASGAAEKISYNGDINGSGSVTPVDGTMINDELQKEANRGYTLTDKQRFEMDVNGDGQVATSDIVLILQRYVGNTTV